MKKKSILARILVVAVLITSMCPLCIFAEDLVFNISGYVDIISDPEPSVNNTSLFNVAFDEANTTLEQFVQGLKKGVRVTVEGTDFSAVCDADGFFEIKNVPAKETGYVLKFSGNLLNGKEVVLDSFIKDVYYDKSSPVKLRFDWDLNDDGAINMKDVTLVARYINQIDVYTHKISGYVKIKMISKVVGLGQPFPENFVEELTSILIKKVKVEVKGTAFSAVTDSNGYFEIKNVPASESGYVLEFSIGNLAKKELAINLFNQDITYDPNNSVTLEVDQDTNRDGIINMEDVKLFASYFNQVDGTHKISGYIKIKPWGTSGSETLPFVFRKGVMVELKGTDYSAITDANGYFEINNILNRVTSNVLKFTGKDIIEKEIALKTFNKDITYDKSNCVVLEGNWDADGDGYRSKADVEILAARLGKCYKLSGYVAPDFKSETSVKDHFAVEVDGIPLTRTNDSGYFKINYLPGNETGYTIKITKFGYLYKEVKIDSFISDMEISSIEKPLLMNVGDINNDNAVNIKDIVVIASAFNTKVGDDKYKKEVDLNADGGINLVDIVIVSRNFNKIAQAL